MKTRTEEMHGQGSLLLCKKLERYIYISKLTLYSVVLFGGKCAEFWMPYTETKLTYLNFHITARVYAT